MRCVLISSAAFLLSFIDFSFSQTDEPSVVPVDPPDKLSMVSMKSYPAEMRQFARFANTSARWVFTDVDLTKWREALAQEDESALDLSDDELVEMRLKLIYPYTKWCGPGNKAESFEDLGSAVEADKCCRAHDKCPDVVEAGGSKFGLTNTATYSTRLSCECDEEFSRCLHAADTKVANQIGTIYFNIIGQKCYRKDYPITGCRERGGWFNRKCLQYDMDLDGEKKYQWFYVHNY